MRNFQPADVTTEKSTESDGEIYRFWMSAEDLARYGALIANGGTWAGAQIIPKDWITESLTAYSQVD
jgi:CubicO group peptidase (beta-lactamase class C family)